MTQSNHYLPPGSRGLAPSYQRLAGQKILVVGGGQAPEETCGKIGAEGNKSFALELDVRDPQQIETQITAAHNKLGGLDGLVYNVGFGNELFFENMTAESWDAVM